MKPKLPSLLLSACAAGLLLVGCESLRSGSKDASSSSTASAADSRFVLNDKDYFQNRGVGVMVFADAYPESRQSGVILVSHGTRIASNGDLRLEAAPGQWSATPKLVKREVDRERGEIRATLAYPDDRLKMKGFNPIYYPDLELTYDLRVNTDGEVIHVYVDLHDPLPAEWIGEVGFNLGYTLPICLVNPGIWTMPTAFFLAKPMGLM